MRMSSVDHALKHAQELIKAGKFSEAEAILNQIFNQCQEWPVMYYLGTLHMKAGHYEQGARLLREVINQKPEFAEGWNNLGICLKNQWRKDEAGAAFQEAMKQQSDQADFPSNWSGCYINEGEPEKCLELANKALEIDPDHVQGNWHKALALLELQRFGEAWPHHEARLLPGSGCGVAERNYAQVEFDDNGENPIQRITPKWNGKTPGLVVIHGEQGLGDEVMFASIIPELVEKYPDNTFVFESSPRTHDLFERSLPCEVHGTHRLDGSEWMDFHEVVGKIAVGSLPMYVKRDTAEDFPGTAYLKPNKKMARKWRKNFKQLSDKPKIGIAWQGGAHNTRVDLRSIPFPEIEPLIRQDATFISLQYTKSAAEEVAAMKEHTGLTIHHWGEVAHAHNLDEYAAMISELDLVISVCQTAIHLAGGLGVECWCITPAAPAWRYGVHGDMPWYESVHLIRQQKGESWTHVVERVTDTLEHWIDQRKLPRTEPETASGQRSLRDEWSQVRPDGGEPLQSVQVG